MPIMCDFRNIQQMAKSVCNDAQQIQGRRFSPRPWNRFEPDDTDWWIVPSTEWPAYRYGKGMFRLVEYLPGQVLICLNVEKGFAPIVAEAFPSLASRGQIIDEQWAWHRFLQGLKDGSVGQIVKDFDEDISSELIIEISAWYPSDYDDFDPYSLPLRDSSIDEGCRSAEDAGLIWFKIEGEELKKLGDSCVGEIVEPIAGCLGFIDLSNALQTSPKLPWAWIDISVGVLVSLLSESQKPTDAWGSTQIWNRLLRPWLPWIA